MARTSAVDAPDAPRGSRTPGGPVALLSALSVVLTCLAGLGVAEQPRAAAAHPRHPNVVVVLTDDQRVGTVRRMPHVWSQVRRKGALFTHAMVPTPLCCPSRAALLSGQFAHRTGVYSNTPPYGGWRVFHRNGWEQRTIAVALHDQGYRTGLVGKYLNGSAPHVARGYRPPGWDTFVSFTTETSAYYHYGLSDGTHHAGRAADYSTDVLRSRAVRFIRSTPRQQPLFLYFAPFAPHAPYTPAPRHVGDWADRLPRYRPPSVTASVVGMPPWVRRHHAVPQRRIDRVRERQQEALMGVDDAVRRMTAALRASGRLRDTLFVFLSDNGLTWGDHHLLGKKDVPYRAAVDVPLVMRWDGHIRPGTTRDRVALNVDVTRTIADATGSPMRTKGVDLLHGPRRGGFVLEGSRWQKYDSLRGHSSFCGYRTAERMYVRYNTGQEELYNYRRDPWEVHDLAHDPAHARLHRAMRASARRACVPRPPGYHW